MSGMVTWRVSGRGETPGLESTVLGIDRVPRARSLSSNVNVNTLPCRNGDAVDQYREQQSNEKRKARTRRDLHFAEVT